MSLLYVLSLVCSCIGGTISIVCGAACLGYYKHEKGYKVNLISAIVAAIFFLGGLITTILLAK